MNLSYNWLKELVPFDLSPEDLARELTRVGLCVEELVPGAEDTMLVADVTTNRPDWLCHHGVAHEIAAFTGLAPNLPEVRLREAGGRAVTDYAAVDNRAPDLCPRYTARVVTGVSVGASPAWLRDRLAAVGLKPRNNVVDITNYVLFEMNQPLHAFDYDLVRDGRIVVRRAEPDEPFVSVFDERRALDPDMCVIADAQGPLALAGVKGGNRSAVHEGTTTVLLEAAYFDPAATRRTSRRAQLDSDSSYRFERGVDPGGVERASRRACQLIAELAGGAVAPGVIDTNPQLAAPWTVKLRYARSDKLLGLHVEPDEIRAILQGLGLKIVDRDAAQVTVEVPTFRGDLTREADLIEEVARCHGYDRVPARVSLPLTAAHEAPTTRARRVSREVLVGLGYHETCTDTFVPAQWNASWTSVAQGAPVRIENPVREDRPELRTSLVPGLLDARRTNRGQGEVRLFEISRAYAERKGERSEPEHLALLDDRGPAWVRGGLEVLLRELRTAGAPTVRALAEAPEGYAPGTAAELQVNGKAVAVYGRVSDALAASHDLHAAPAVLEANFATILTLERADKSFRPLPRFPGVERDVALVVPESVRWADVEAAVRALPDRVEGVELASIYRGEQVPPGTKSVALRVLYRDLERSLTDEEANALRDRMVEHLTSVLPDARLR